MSTNNELRQLGTHFEFGRNWSSYAELIDKGRIESAQNGLIKLVPQEEIKGRRFLDIGCGSGLHSLAAARLGATAICACDLDPNSVETARAVLARHAGEAKWSVSQTSVFDLDNLGESTFDIVYSWGALHHTGDMLAAVRAATAQVKPGGLFVCALYRCTWLDGFWRWEKKFYAKASPRWQKAVLGLYDRAYRLAAFLTGRRAKIDRGMEYRHDLHDWLGGYPYESIMAHEFDELMQAMKFAKVRVFARPRSIGIFGSGCDEYVYRAPVSGAC